MIERFPDSDIRSYCRSRIEALELWLRRLIDVTLTLEYGDYFNHSDPAGNRIIKKALVANVDKRMQNEPERYPRRIDAVLLEDAISIICNEHLFKKHFATALNGAFPDGRDEAHTFMTRLLEPRNRLSHATAISAHHAERVVCYTSDIVNSIKQYYVEENMDEEYNVPTIIKVTDWLGNTFHRDQMSPVHDGGIQRTFSQDPRYHLRPGDTLILEVEVDPSYPTSEYTVRWQCTKGLNVPDNNSPRLVLPIVNKYVGGIFWVQCMVRTHRDWHRMHIGEDDFMMLLYKVLPPLS